MRARGRSVRTPGGRPSIHRRGGKAKASRCAWCGRELGGTPKARVGKLRGLPKSSKRPKRPFGGHLCPTCTRQLMKKAARA